MPARHSVLSERLQRAWLTRGPLAWALLPVSFIFLCLVALRRLLYRAGLLRSVRLPVPVIVVGNVFVGGTGKTPFTIWLVEALRKQGFRPGVVSRGYGGAQAQPRQVAPEGNPAEVGDEPLLIARQTRVPVFVGRDRALAGQALLHAFPEVNVIVADDGLQHYRLARDVEIVVCDARGNGNGWLLPAGPLREPSTRRRDFTVVNGAPGVADVTEPVFQMDLQAHHAFNLGNPDQRCTWEQLRDSQQTIAAAAGIGNPARFFGTLRACGLHIEEEVPLPDHYDFSDNPFARVQADVILITEKDAVKCVQFEPLKNDPRLWVVPVSAQVDAALAHRIVEKCRGSPTA